MSRRTAERHSRRVEIKFWRRGNPQPHTGFSIDVSKTGLFLGTSQQLEPDERVRLEFVDRERGFIVEGKVARVHRVALALRHVEQPGVGVRFLSAGEMIAELLGAGRPKTGSFQVTPRQESPEPERGKTSSEAPSPTVLPPTVKPITGATPLPPRPARVVPVEFVDRSSFLSVYHRDIAAGGLFVTTAEPAPLHDIVTIELRPPISTPHPLCFEARVVHRFDTKPGEAPSGNPNGMGVQFLDPDRVRTTLAPILIELKR